MSSLPRHVLLELRALASMRRWRHDQVMRCVLVYPLFCLNWGRNTDRWCLKKQKQKLSLRCFRWAFRRIWRGSQSFHFQAYFSIQRLSVPIGIWTFKDFFCYSKTVCKNRYQCTRMRWEYGALNVFGFVHINYHFYACWVRIAKQGEW